jgi:hypothetical protein
MVLLSAGKMARNAASIVNRPNCGGGAKKAGTAPRVGWYLTSNVNLVGAPQSVPRFCIPSRTIQTQKYGVRATHGGNMG